ncbi:MAG: hypothetical protein IT513_18995 [Burkholderiales bacterium]|nr:hypothetical protein [Burkholderiales bacterium]
MSELVLQHGAASLGFRVAGTSVAGTPARELRNRQRLLQLYFPARERLAQELSNLLDPQVVASWYGTGTKPVDVAALAAALGFLSMLPPAVLANLEVSPDNDGAISFDWFVGSDRQLSISLGAHGELHYAAVLGSVERVSGRLLFDDSIPEAIVRLLRRIS